MQASGYLIERFDNAFDAEIAVLTSPYNMIILDPWLTAMDGLQFLKRIRSKKVSLPILILTARDSYEERIEGLDCGANDYIAKPFHLGEHEARIRALARRL